MLKVLPLDLATLPGSWKPVQKHWRNLRNVLGKATKCQKHINNLERQKAAMRLIYLLLESNNRCSSTRLHEVQQRDKRIASVHAALMITLYKTLGEELNTTVLTSLQEVEDRLTNKI